MADDIRALEKILEPEEFNRRLMKAIGIRQISQGDVETLLTASFLDGCYPEKDVKSIDGLRKFISDPVYLFGYEAGKLARSTSLDPNKDCDLILVSFIKNLGAFYGNDYAQELDDRLMKDPVTRPTFQKN